MTAIKQIAITGAQHMKSLSGYLDRANGKHDVLDFDSRNLTDPENWSREMDRTREAYGHNEPGRKGSKCTYCYHQIIAFNPDECDVNGGKMSRDSCMEFAREWVGRYYPNQETAWTLHLEHSRDGTDRYAVHIAINRTDLETGKRLNDGRASRQRTLHAARMREMDGRWGLVQLERGTRNSRVHARQESRGEQRAREIGSKADPGFETDQDHVRRVVRESVREVAASDAPNRMRALNEALERRGVHMRLSRDRNLGERDLVFEYRPTYDRRDTLGHAVRKAAISGRKLGRGFTRGGIRHALGIGAAVYRMAERSMDDGRDNEM